MSPKEQHPSRCRSNCARVAANLSQPLARAVREGRQNHHSKPPFVGQRLMRRSVNGVFSSNEGKSRRFPFTRLSKVDKNSTHYASVHFKQIRDEARRRKNSYSQRERIPTTQSVALRLVLLRQIQIISATSTLQLRTTKSITRKTAGTNPTN